MDACYAWLCLVVVLKYLIGKQVIKRLKQSHWFSTGFINRSNEGKVFLFNQNKCFINSVCCLVIPNLLEILVK